ncbi:MAG: DUF192 domain-containing protein [Pseudomonadota bacterium]
MEPTRAGRPVCASATLPDAAWQECFNLSQARLVAGRVAPAHDLLPRIKGLLGRSGLDPDQGLWLAPCRQVHTLFMRFAIDVVFLDRRLRVVKVCRRLGPWRLSPLCWRAASALEMPAGAAAAVREGDQLAFRPGAAPAAEGMTQ